MSKDRNLTKAGLPRKREPRDGEGRGTKYKPEYCQEIIDYFNSFRIEVINDKVFAPDLPQFSKWARKIGVEEKTIYNWKSEYPEFLQSFDTCLAIQRELLQDFSLKGLYNPTIAKMILNVNHDMVEKKITQHSGSIERKTSEAELQIFKEFVNGIQQRAVQRNPKK